MISASSRTPPSSSTLNQPSNRATLRMMGEGACTYRHRSFIRLWAEVRIGSYLLDNLWAGLVFIETTLRHAVCSSVRNSATEECSLIVRRLCEGCLRPSRAHTYNLETLRGTCGVCRKKVRFVKTSEYTALPDRHYIKKRDPRLRRSRKRRNGRSRSSRSRSGR